MKRNVIWFVVLILLIGTSCSSEEEPDQVVAPESELVCPNFEILEAGELRFDFEGDTSGVYETEGRINAINSYVSVEISAGRDIHPVTIFGRFVPEGVEARQDFRFNISNLKGIRNFELPGPFQIDFFRLSGNDEEEIYFITSGKVNLSEFNCDLIEGNFYASASTSDGSKTISIKNGYFRAVQ